MFEDEITAFLQKYLGNYVEGFDSLKISVWRGDVELTNMQLKPEALDALKLPVKVKAGFLGSVKLKVPWDKLGLMPILIYVDRIFLFAEPATQIERYSENALQEAKKSRIMELEMELLEQQQQLEPEMNTSWMGPVIRTILGNVKLSITNIHIIYKDMESNPGHPFAAGLTLSRFLLMTTDDSGNEIYATCGDLKHVKKGVKLDRLAFYLDSDISPWHTEIPWDNLSSLEWNRIFELGVSNGFKTFSIEHDYILQPVSVKANYTNSRVDESRDAHQAVINLDDVTLSLSKDGYRDIMKLSDNFVAFNQRLKYARYRPQVPLKSDPKAWWRYAYNFVTDEAKKASEKFYWEQVLHYARIRNRYLSLYVSLLKADLNRMVVDDNEEIDKLDRELDIGVILQWRMLAHKFVEQSVESDPIVFAEEECERLNKVSGYKDGCDEKLMTTQETNFPHLSLEIYMKHIASKLIADGQEYLADLSCEGLSFLMNTYSETKVFNLKLESYTLLCSNGLLAESAYFKDSFVGEFTYKPFDAEINWRFDAKAPSYVTYLKDSIDQIISFFKRNTYVIQNIALVVLELFSPGRHEMLGLAKCKKEQ